MAKAPAHLDEQLGYNLGRAALLHRRELTRVLREHGLTPEQWQTLSALGRSGPLIPSRLADVTLQDLPSLSRMLVRMEGKGWVERKSDDADRRSFKIHLTKEGKRLEKTLPVRISKHFQGALAKFPAKKQQALLDGLRELRTSMGDPVE